MGFKGFQVSEKGSGLGSNALGSKAWGLGKLLKILNVYCSDSGESQQISEFSLRFATWE